jgi:hypothetical protein
VWLFERRQKASSGPIASRSWKPGKRMMPILLGRGETGILMGSIAMLYSDYEMS